MHWPKAFSKPLAPAPVPAPKSKDPDDKKEDKTESDGTFNPAQLERAAVAVREFDNSKNARFALELAGLEEGTAQFEQTLKAEAETTRRFQTEHENHQLKADEQRKTVSHVADQERATAQHKAQVEAGLQGKKLEQNLDQLNRQLEREHEHFLQQEQIRMQTDVEVETASRETMRRKAELDREVAMSTAKAMAQGRAEQERQNIEIRLRELRARKAEERETRLKTINEVFESLSGGATALYEDPSKVSMLIGGLTALAVGVYGARAGIGVASSVVERYIGRPPLVRETSRWTWRPNLGFWAMKERPGIFGRIVLEAELQERLQWTTNALLRARENGTPFRHLLLHGNPGTGKTLFARTLARQSGLDYAIMSGGDLGPLGKDGPEELHKLFGWANNSKKGMVLFIDEADAFLRRGRSSEASMSEDARNALSVFLTHTGNENSNISVILATNIRSVLDPAVLDRVDEHFEFPLPKQEQRMDMLRLFVEDYLHKPAKSKPIEVDPDINDVYLEEVARRTEGLSGRQLAKLVLAFQSAVFGSGTRRLSKGMADTVVSWRLAHAA